MPRKSKTAVTVKKAPLHAQLSSADIDDIINSVSVPTAPLTPTSPKKRKVAVAISDDDSSGIEVVEGLHPSPKKSRPASLHPSPKKTRTATPPPSPGTSAFKDLPPVSVSDLLDNSLMNPAPKLTFGSIGSQPQRIREKTFKAAQLEEQKSLKKKRSGARDVKMEVVESSDELFGLEDGVKKNTSGIDVHWSPSPSVTDLGVSHVTPINAPLSDDDLPEVSELALVTPRKKGHHSLSTPTKAYKEAHKYTGPAVGSDTDPGNSDVEVLCSDQETGHELIADDGVSQGSDSIGSEDDAANPGDVLINKKATTGNLIDQAVTNTTAPVTSPMFQDKPLCKYYINLPFLEKFVPIAPYSQSAAPTTSTFEYSKIARTLNTSDATMLLKALLFTQSDCYVNLSRIQPDRLKNDNGHIRLAREGSISAVAMFTGLCTRSAITDVDLVGHPSSPYNVHGVTIAGSGQDTRRYMAMMAHLLNYESITGNISADGLSFYTRGENKDGKFANAPQAQFRNSASSRPVSSLITKVSMASPTPVARTYPPSIGFGDNIPVYDGRAATGRPFTFSDEDFMALGPSWRSYPCKHGEIEDQTVISVGHTINTFLNGTPARRLMADSSL